jgi:prepilin-type N-terminal cleavage/methylation domain-containing protein
VLHRLGRQIKTVKIRANSKSRKGYTLVETVVAAAILTVAVSGVMVCFGYGFLIMQHARENQRATQIMLEKVEIIRLYSWDQVNTPGFVPSTFTDVYDPKSATAPGVTYQGTLAIRDAPISGVNYATNVKEFLITLNWTTQGRVQHTRTLSTLVAKDGIQNYVY